MMEEYKFSKEKKAIRIRPTDTISMQITFPPEWWERYKVWVLETGETMDGPEFKELNEKLLKIREKIIKDSHG